jgi:phosphatidylglycerophosphate synthase
MRPGGQPPPAAAMTDLPTGAPFPGPRRGAAAAIALVGLATAAGVHALPFRGPLPAWACAAAMAVVAAVVLDRLARYHPHPRFGLGNGITLVRAGGVAVLAALALEPNLVAGRSAWAVFAGAVLLLALDGLDGWVARQQGMASAFGARFDLEVDAALILALAAIALGLGKAGPWVLGLGLLRYGFVAAGCLVPALARPLPPSNRRRAVCGLQVAVLALLLAPPVAPPWSALLAAAGFAALAASFAVDVAWLLRGAR